MADTIYAVSSGALPAGIAVVRVSGPAALTILTTVAGPAPPPRQAALRRLRDANGALIDQALVLWFPGPRTATGDDIVEFHVHGGHAVVARMLAVLGDQPAARAAEPGEFTRRAFLNGRIDLLEAEALGDLLSAETEQQRRSALAMADGALGRRIDPWRAEALRLAALVEAGLNFGDEDDASAASADIADAARGLAVSIEAVLAAPPVERLRDGIAVVLAGPPNAGKSSLLNALVQRDAAIVSPFAGTTRDIVEVPVTIGGTAFLFSDTAGLRTGAEAIEQIGIERARDRIARADLLLWLGDDPPPIHVRSIWLFPRCDVRQSESVQPERLPISSRTGEGLPALARWMLEQAGSLLPQQDQIALSQRQRQEVTAAALAAHDAARQSDTVLQAEALRQVRKAFDRLTGRAGFEDLLDTIFGQFCLGK